MQELTHNPALLLRTQVAALGLPGFLRWDTSGQALLASDAPRHPDGLEALAALDRNLMRAETRKGLLFFDLPEAAYATLCASTFYQPGCWSVAHFDAQALLGGILQRKRVESPSAPPDRPLLRACMLACAQAEHMPAFLRMLRLADAQALRLQRTASTRACACLCAHWYWQCHNVGIPSMRFLQI